MGRRAAILILAGMMLVPASALGASRPYVGSLADVSNPSAIITFTAIGKVNRKGKFKATKVKAVKVTQVPYTCETPSHEVTTIRRSDLPWISLGLLPVNTRGGFGGRFDPGIDSSFQVTGGFHNGKASGSLLGYEGTPNVSTTCTTSQHRWTARELKPVCAQSAARPLCSGPPRAP
jgi:hypothetical protein